jgi:hypothetical protein
VPFCADGTRRQAILTLLRSPNQDSVSCPARQRLACPTYSPIWVPICSPCPDHPLVERPCRFYASGRSFGVSKGSSGGLVRDRKNHQRTHQHRPWVVSSGPAHVITVLLAWHLRRALGWDFVGSRPRPSCLPMDEWDFVCYGGVPRLPDRKLRKAAKERRRLCPTHV